MLQNTSHHSHDHGEGFTDTQLLLMMSNPAVQYMIEPFLFIISKQQPGCYVMTMIVPT